MEFERLVPLMNAEFRARQVRLADLKRQEEALRQRLSDLSDRRSVSREGELIDPATLSGADLRWQAWAEARRSEINQMIARLRVDQHKATRELQWSFGRQSVAKRIVEAGGPRRLK